MSLDKFFFKTYNRKYYNCAHLTCDVWQELTGQDLRDAFRGFLNGRGETRAILKDLRRFRKLDAPVSPCIVLFQSSRMAPHVGVFVRGKVLHIQPRGVEYQPVEVVAVGFKHTRFYTC